MTTLGGQQATRGGQQATTVGTGVVESRLARGGEGASPPCCRAPQGQGQSRDIFQIFPFFFEFAKKQFFFRVEPGSTRKNRGGKEVVGMIDCPTCERGVHSNFREWSVFNNYREGSIIHSPLLCTGFFLAPLFEQSSLLWSNPVGARRRRSKVLRCRAPLGSGWLRVVRGGCRLRLPRAPGEGVLLGQQLRALYFKTDMESRKKKRGVNRSLSVPLGKGDSECW